MTRAATVLLTGVCLALGVAAAQPLAGQEPAGPAPGRGAVVLRACGPYGELTARLGRKFKESPAAYGLQGNGNLLQVFVSAETGTWTVVSTAPSGTSCIVAAGESWETLPAPNDDPLA